jgi:RNA polymerase sigma-70 factor (ECF subfamily)
MIEMLPNRFETQDPSTAAELREISRDSADKLVDQVQPIVNAVLRRLLGTDDPEYEDIVQSSLEHVIATVGAGRYRGECPAPGWAAVIARNVAVDALRARSRDRKVFSRDQNEEALQKSSAAETGPEYLADVHKRLRQVEAALSRLNQRKAAVVYMHDVLGYGLVDVAARLGTTVAAAQSRLVRGRRELLGSVKKERNRSAGTAPRPPRPREGQA